MKPMLVAWASPRTQIHRRNGASSVRAWSWDQPSNGRRLTGAEWLRRLLHEPLAPEDIAEAILYAVGGPERVAVNEVLVRPAGQRR